MTYVLNMWNTYALTNIIMGIENMRNLGVWESVSLESLKECAEFWDPVSINRG